MRTRVPLAFLAGAVSVLAHAPFGVFPLALVSLAALAFLLGQARGGRRGFVLGFAWGLGAFLVGVSWLFIALQRYGGMSVPLAALAILLFCSLLAIFPAIAGALFVRLRPAGAMAQSVLFGALWLLMEWARGWVFTGFPWLSVGYTQTPPSPLAGFAPLLGVYGVGGLLALLSGLLAFSPWRRLRTALPAVLTLGLVLFGGVLLTRVAWTAPSGEVVRVALLQTNIEQDLKWRPDHLREWLRVNVEMVAASQADLVVLPEGAAPLLIHHLPEGYLDLLAESLREPGANLILGTFTTDGAGGVLNSAISLGASPGQHYAKHHLVPFGEFSPPLFGWVYRLVNIPMSDQVRGATAQPPMLLGGQKVAVNICFEDLFGDELRAALPEAGLMLNMSNLAWFGDSLALPQHLQVARMRALEAGRPMLRATNTGATAVIRPDGGIQSVLPAMTRGILHAEVRAHHGLTPYARWGDAPVVLLAGLYAMLVAGCMTRRPRAAKCQ